MNNEPADKLNAAKGILIGLLISLALWYLFFYAIHQRIDYTDTGVGCVDDCLELELQVER